MDESVETFPSSSSRRTSEAAEGAPRRPSQQKIFLALPAALSIILFVGVVLSLVLSIIQTALLSYDSYRIVVQSTGFAVFNLIAQCWLSFAFFFIMAYGSSVSFIRTNGILCGLLSVFLGVWCYFYFSSPDYPLSRAGLIFIFILQAGLYISSGVFLAENQYRFLGSRPVDADSFGIFIGALRLSFIVVIPIVARFINQGAASIPSFFAVVSFVASAACFAVNIRLATVFSKRAKTMNAVLARMNFRDFVLGYGNIFAVLICFVIFYVIEFSSITVPDVLLFAVFVFLATSLMLSWAVSFATLSQWKSLKALSAIRLDRKIRRADSISTTRTQDQSNLEEATI